MRTDGGVPRVQLGPHRRHWHGEGAEQLPAGLGDGRQHAAQALQAEHPRGWGSRSTHHQLAAVYPRAGRCPHAVPPRGRHRADDPRRPRRRAPVVLRGIEQMPLHGTSMVYTFDGDVSDAASPRSTSRCSATAAIWADGLKAVAYHVRYSEYDDDVWELYHLDEDFSECNDLAKKEPERLQKLVQLWWEEAEKYDDLSLDDRGFAERRAMSKGRPGLPESGVISSSAPVSSTFRAARAVRDRPLVSN